MENKLLPCPFCGGEAEIIEVKNNPPETIAIQCKSGCGVSLHHKWMEQEVLIKLWNTRAERTFPDEVQEAQHHLCELERITGETWRPERTCTFSKHEKAGDPYPTCSSCGYETDWHECEWYSDDMFVYEKNYCPNCGSKVIRNAD